MLSLRTRIATIINGRSAYIEKIFINSKGKGMSAKTTYIELFGKDEKTGEDRYERLNL